MKGKHVVALITLAVLFGVNALVVYVCSFFSIASWLVFAISIVACTVIGRPVSEFLQDAYMIHTLNKGLETKRRSASGVDRDPTPSIPPVLLYVLGLVHVFGGTFALLDFYRAGAATDAGIATVGFFIAVGLVFIGLAVFRGFAQKRIPR
jgi:hypothetical protein